MPTGCIGNASGQEPAAAADEEEIGLMACREDAEMSIYRLTQGRLLTIYILTHGHKVATYILTRVANRCNLQENHHGRADK